LYIELLNLLNLFKNTHTEASVFIASLLKNIKTFRDKQHTGSTLKSHIYGSAQNARLISFYVSRLKVGMINEESCEIEFDRIRHEIHLILLEKLKKMANYCVLIVSGIQ